uniref:Uncharacterized protein n=1 Tax=Meloidogyne javanica TaxID=6303 RepID=A0A915NCJ5_MELJA
MSNIPEREGSEGHDDKDQQKLQKNFLKILQETVEVSYFHYNDTRTKQFIGEALSKILGYFVYLSSNQMKKLKMGDEMHNTGPFD